MNVLSLCDGMSGGQISLRRAGIQYENYYASEVKDIAIKVTNENYPNTIQIGDVNKIRYQDGVLYTENGSFKTRIDLVIFGSPCQTFSIAIPTNRRIGLDDFEKSGLFYECYRVLSEVNPTYFMMENVASMRKSDRDIITSIMGVEPLVFDSKNLSPALRKRYYWTNISNIEELPRKNIKLQSILTEGHTDREKARCLAVIDSRPNTTPIKMFHRYYSTGFTTLIFKSEQHYISCVEHYEKHFKGMSAKEIDQELKDNPIDISIYNGVRYMNQVELERCQTVPEGYTKCLTRNEAADVLGDGWTIDVIAHILKSIKDA